MFYGPKFTRHMCSIAVLALHDGCNVHSECMVVERCAQQNNCQLVQPLPYLVDCLNLY